MLPDGYFFIALVTISVVVACVLIHYEGMRLLSDRLPRPKAHPRKRLILVILSLQFIHVTCIWLFGLVYLWVLTDGGYGELAWDAVEALAPGR